MDVREFTIRSITVIREGTLSMVGELKQDEMGWRPVSFANPIGFILFHLFRIDDRYFHRWLSELGEVWEREGWDSRWQLPEPHPDAPELWYSQTGNSWTPEQVAAREIPPKDELLEYGDRVRGSTLKVLEQLDIGQMDLAPRPERPELTYAHYLHMASHHEAQH